MSNSTSNNNNQGINLVDIFFYLLSKWKWFVLSVLIFGGLAWYIYAKTPQIYFQKATVIIKDPSNKTSSAGLDRYDNLINKVSVANEIFQFRSKKLMGEVIKRVRADINYLSKDGLRDKELYTRAPIAVSFVDMLPSAYSSLTVTPQHNNTVVVSDISGMEEGASLTVNFNISIKVRDRTLLIAPTNFSYEYWLDDAFLTT